MAPRERRRPACLRVAFHSFGPSVGRDRVDNMKDCISAACHPLTSRCYESIIIGMGNLL